MCHLCGPGGAPILTSLIFQQIDQDVFEEPHLIIVIEDRKLFEHLNRVRISLGWLKRKPYLALKKTHFFMVLFHVTQFGLKHGQCELSHFILICRLILGVRSKGRHEP